MAIYGNLNYFTRINPETGRDYPVESRQRVFISYRKVDVKKDRLCEKLKDIILSATDCAVWYDSQLTPGQNYDDEIEQAIKLCDVVVLLVTENVFLSKYIFEKEIPYAKKYKKRIIPVLVGSSKAAILRIEKCLGHVQICMWDYESEESNANFIEQFPKYIDRYITDANTKLKIEQCFSAGKHLLSRRYLSMEDIYLISIGYLKGIGTESNLDKAEKSIRSLLSYRDSDPQLEVLKDTAKEQLVEWYKTQVINALLEDNVQAIFNYHERCLRVDCDLLYSVGMGLISVIDYSYKKLLAETDCVATGAKLLRLRITYHYTRHAISANVCDGFDSWSIALDYPLLTYLSQMEDRSKKEIVIKFILKYYTTILDAIKEWDRYDTIGKVKDFFETVRKDNIYSIFGQEFPFDPFAVTNDCKEMKTYVIKAIVDHLMLIYSMHDEACSMLGHIFYDGLILPQDRSFALAVMDYGALLNPALRKEAKEMARVGKKTTEYVYPDTYVMSEGHFPSPKRQGEMRIKGVDFYFIMVTNSEMYFMRDDEVVLTFACWTGTGGDATTFDCRYSENDDTIEILIHEFTHYDRDTECSKVVLRYIFDEEVECEWENLPTISGRHALRIDSRNRN